MRTLKRLIVSLLAVFFIACATPIGTQFVLQLAAAAAGGRLSIGQVRGNLLAGAVISDARLARVPLWPREVSVRVGQMDLAGPLDIRRRPILHATDAAITLAGREAARVDDVAWRLQEGVEVRGLVIHDLALAARLVPSGSGPSPAIAIQSGLFELPNSEPVWFSFMSRDGRIDAYARAPRLSVNDLPALRGQAPGAWSGGLQDVVVRAQGRLAALDVEGTFQVSLSTPFAKISGCSGIAAVTLGRSQGVWTAVGSAGCEGGMVSAERAGARLRTLGLDWAGGDRPLNYDMVLEDLQIDGAYQLPADVAASMQRVRVQGSWPGEPIPEVNVFNGRLWLPRSDPTFFSGGWMGGQWDLKFYTSMLNLRDLWAVIHAGPKLSVWRGRVKEFDGSVQGPLLAPVISGQCHLEYISGRLLTVADVPGTLKLEITPNLEAGGTKLRLNGEIVGNHGTVQLRHTSIALLPGRIVFEGNPKAPRLEAQGTTTVAGTRIHVVTQGMLRKPDIKLTSDPPMPQERLLVMLATGKAWRTVGSNIDEGWLTPDLATDALDYFVFGGEGGRMASRLGISETSLQFNPEQQRIGASATFADRIELRVEAGAAGVAVDDETINRAAAAATPVPERAYKLGAAYKLTPSTSVGVEGGREPLAQRSTAAQGASGTPAPNVDDTIFLKLKRRF